MPRRGTTTTERSALLTTAEAAVQLRVSIRTIQRMRGDGTLPSIVMHGKRVFFQQSDLDAYLAAKRS